MAMPKWATPERRNHLVQLAQANKGRCLQGHLPCSVLEHFIHTYTQVEVASGKVTAADVRAGRAVTYPCHGVGIVELAQFVSGGDAPRLRWDSNNQELPPVVVKVIGPKRVAVLHEELSDTYGLAEERTIEGWKQDDREERSAQRQDAAQLAPTGEAGQFTQFSTGKSWRRNLDPIELEKHVANRPNYYLMGYGVDGQMRRFAKVRISGTKFILQVDVSQSAQAMGRNKRRYLRRKGVETQTQLDLIESAVAQWWAR